MSGDPRQEVQWFARHMERRLAANDHKGGWQDEDVAWLMSRLHEEADELLEALRAGFVDLPTVVHEAADVANFALMIADVVCRRGGLEP